MNKLNIKNQSNSRESMCIKANGKIINEMDVELKYGREAQFLKDTGKIMWLMVMVDWFMLMEMSM